MVHFADDTGRIRRYDDVGFQFNVVPDWINMDDGEESVDHNREQAAASCRADDD